MPPTGEFSYLTTLSLVADVTSLHSGLLQRQVLMVSISKKKYLSKIQEKVLHFQRKYLFWYTLIGRLSGLHP